MWVIPDKSHTGQPKYFKKRTLLKLHASYNDSYLHATLMRRDKLALPVQVLAYEEIIFYHVPVKLVWTVQNRNFLWNKG